MTQLDRRLLMGMMAGATVSPLAFPAAADPAALGADIDLLQRIYETLHPGLYRYQTPAEFKLRCASLKASLQKPASVQGQYLALSHLLAQVRCGHTYANFFNQSKSIDAKVVEPANKLPFHFVWLGGRLVVTANPLHIDGIQPGDEIVAIDGVSSDSIQDRLLPFIRGDGANDDKRRALLSVSGGDRIETFDVFYPLLFPIERSHFRLAARRGGNGLVKTIDVAPIDQKTREGMMAQAAKADTPDYWALSWPAPKTAVITMPGWAMYKITWDWRARIQAIFEEIAQKDATGLVIDLRDNEGGNDCGNELIAHLIDEDLPLFANSERRVRFRSTPPDLNPYLDTWDRSFQHLGEGADDLGNGFFRLKNDEDEVRKISPRGRGFVARSLSCLVPKTAPRPSNS
jgi:hypothetical protein